MQDSNAHVSGETLDVELEVLMATSPPLPDACLNLGRQLYRIQRFADGARLTLHALNHHPDAHDLWNLRGVFLRLLGQPADALIAFDAAIRVKPGFVGAEINRGNVFLDLNDHRRALSAFTRALELEPEGAMPRVMVARALLALNRADESIARLREALVLRRDYAEAWQLLASALHETGKTDEAIKSLAESLEANPSHPMLLEAMALLLRVSGRRQATEAFLSDILARQPDTPWACFHLGDLLAGRDTARAVRYLKQALTLAPEQVDYAFALLRALCRNAMHDDGGMLDEAFALARTLAARPELKPAQTVLLRDAFALVCAHEDLERLGGFEKLGRSWAAAGLNASLMFHLAQAETPDRARELLAQHRIWGQAAEAGAALTPLAPAARRNGARIRVGFMSSDLRDHPVGRFTLPLFEHIDRERFEVFVYSFFPGPVDAVQARIGELADGVRSWPETPAREVAKRIAMDQLDMLIELGGPTEFNLPEVLAWRPAPIQASWLGYPHSIGLSAVDYFICDAFNAPESLDLLLEAPLLMPTSWIVISRSLFAAAPTIAAEVPERRRGFLTFGTANNPYKYTRNAVVAWAKIVASVPGSRFAFIRPEAGSRAFQQNVSAIFASEGVTANRLEWRPTRGDHLAAYGDIDISLDTFPLTGGTTTVEALLMGVPVISLAGSAFFQRLSRSILSNAGLADLCVDTQSAYVEAALRLAQDPERRVRLRHALRATLLASPLGDQQAFAQDFYDMIYKRVRA
jgi:predicted O-linked N-acetylglucosamine transferase (SPINDLY family)